MVADDLANLGTDTPPDIAVTHGSLSCTPLPYVTTSIGVCWPELSGGAEGDIILTGTADAKHSRDTGTPELIGTMLKKMQPDAF